MTRRKRDWVTVQDNTAKRLMRWLEDVRFDRRIAGVLRVAEMAGQEKR